MVHHDGMWHLWASVHPLQLRDHEDRMTTEYATSHDGIEWVWRGRALAPRRGRWDARGVRLTSVFVVDGRWMAMYDGRATAEENWEERTGLATGQPDGRFTAAPDGPLLQSPHAPHGLRYADVVAVPGGGARWFYEATRLDGAHELRTVLLPG